MKIPIKFIKLTVMTVIYSKACINVLPIAELIHDFTEHLDFKHCHYEFNLKCQTNLKYDTVAPNLNFMSSSVRAKQPRKQRNVYWSKPNLRTCYVRNKYQALRNREMKETETGVKCEWNENNEDYKINYK